MSRATRARALSLARQIWRDLVAACMRARKFTLIVARSTRDIKLCSEASPNFQSRIITADAFRESAGYAHNLITISQSFSSRRRLLISPLLLLLLRFRGIRSFRKPRGRARQTRGHNSRILMDNRGIRGSRKGSGCVIIRVPRSRSFVLAPLSPPPPLP